MPANQYEPELRGLKSGSERSGSQSGSGKCEFSFFSDDGVSDFIYDLSEMVLENAKGCIDKLDYVAGCNEVLGGYVVGIYHEIRGFRPQVCCPACSFEAGKLDTECVKIANAPGGCVGSGFAIVVNGGNVQGGDDEVYCCPTRGLP